MNVHLALVVGGAAAEKLAVTDGGLECRGSPKIERLGGLHVVMAVNKNRGFAGRVQRFAINQRMHFRRRDFDIFQASGA